MLHPPQQTDGANAPTAPPAIDACAHRRLKNYPLGVYVARVVWALVGWPLFRFSPRFFYGWRRMLLRLFGARVGKRVRVYPSTRITFPWNITLATGATVGPQAHLYAVGAIAVGENTLISQEATLCAGSHDYTQAHLPLIKPPITVGAGVWVCAQAFLGPGVVVEDNAVVGARACAMKRVKASTVVTGNPARVVGTR